MLARQTMAYLKEAPLDDLRIEAAAELIGEEVDPPEDPAYPPAYRRHLVQVLLRQALTELLQ